MTLPIVNEEWRSKKYRTNHYFVIIFLCIISKLE